MFRLTPFVLAPLFKALLFSGAENFGAIIFVADLRFFQIYLLKSNYELNKSCKIRVVKVA